VLLGVIACRAVPAVRRHASSAITAFVVWWAVFGVAYIGIPFSISAQPVTAMLGGIGLGWFTHSDYTDIAIVMLIPLLTAALGDRSIEARQAAGVTGAGGPLPVASAAQKFP
jgi:hypothetical protein